MEGLYETDLLPLATQISSLLPYDLSLTSLFLMYQLALTEYVGRCSLDRF